MKLRPTLHYVLWALLLGGAHTLTAGILYNVTDLGTLGGKNSFGYAINNAGHVTGTSDIATPGSYPDAFLYSNGQMTDLGTLGGRSPGSTGFGLNNAGQVTGVSYQNVGPGGEMGTIIVNDAFLYSNGQMMSLRAPDDSFGYGINDAGQVTGYYTSMGVTHAFLYSNGQITDLGNLGGPYDSSGKAINNAGQVTGYSSTPSGAAHAFLYTNGQMNDLGSLPGGFGSFGYSINNAGQVAGFSWTVGTSSPHAFLYSNGQMMDLGTLPGYSAGSSGQAINNAGQVVGYSSAPDTGARHPFLYNNGQMSDLNSLIDPALGLTLVEAYGINDNGQIVVNGIAKSATNEHAYLLTPVPEPSTWALLGLSGLLLSAKLRRSARP